MFTPKSFSKQINKMIKGSSSDDVYYLFCRLAGTVSKQYDEEETLDALEEELEMWIKDTTCFNDK